MKTASGNLGVAALGGMLCAFDIMLKIYYIHNMAAPALTNRIRTLRFLHGQMSQAQLGQRIGVTRQTIAAIEAGKYSPSLEAAFRIAQVFGVPLDQVFEWNATAS
jgi:putative transcriptional regulator